MAEKNFIYSGPISGFTLTAPDGSAREVMLHDGAPPMCMGQPTGLPDDHPHVQALVARGLLQEDEQPERPRRGAKSITPRPQEPS